MTCGSDFIGQSKSHDLKLKEIGKCSSREENMNFWVDSTSDYIHTKLLVYLSDLPGRELLEYRT